MGANASITAGNDARDDAFWTGVNEHTVLTPRFLAAKSRGLPDDTHTALRLQSRQRLHADALSLAGSDAAGNFSAAARGSNARDDGGDEDGASDAAAFYAATRIAVMGDAPGIFPLSATVRYQTRARAAHETYYMSAPSVRIMCPTCASCVQVLEACSFHSTPPTPTSPPPWFPCA